MLGGHHEFKSQDEAGRSQEVLTALEAGLKAFGPIHEYFDGAPDPLPYRGHGVRPDGGVTLAVYARYLHERQPDGPAMIDSLDLSASEWSTLAHRSDANQKDWVVPEEIARKFVRLLSPNSDQSTMPKPEDSKAADMRWKLSDLSANTAFAQLTGRLEAIHLCEGDPKRPIKSKGDLTGIMVVTGKSKTPTRLSITLSGIYRHSPPYDSPREFGAVVEWQRTPKPRPWAEFYLRQDDRLRFRERE